MTPPDQERVAAIVSVSIGPADAGGPSTSSLLRRQVVGRPVVVAGNSIGGYIGAMLAGDHPSLCAGMLSLAGT